MNNSVEYIGFFQDLEIQTLKLQIVTNVISYAVSAMGNGNVINALFSTELGKDKSYIRNGWCLFNETV